MTLSEEILDQIDGATETRGRDTQLTEWARRAEQMEHELATLRNEVSGVSPTMLGLTP